MEVAPGVRWWLSTLMAASPNTMPSPIHPWAASGLSVLTDICRSMLGHGVCDLANSETKLSQSCPSPHMHSVPLASLLPVGRQWLKTYWLILLFICL